MESQTTKTWYDDHYAVHERTLTPWHSGMLEWLKRNKPSGPVVDLGCGTAHLLQLLLENDVYGTADLFGIEQSSEAVAIAKRRLQQVEIGNIEGKLPFADNSLGVVLLAEVIEHLINPWEVLVEIHRVLRTDGVLLISFPNYLNLPWLLLRILADLFDRPSWIVLQPIDRMYTVPLIRSRLRRARFKVRDMIGNTYGPPKLYKWEPAWFRSLLNALGLSGFSFHPVLICKKC